MLATVVLSIAIASAILLYQWLLLVMILLGAGFVAFVFAKPFLALLFWVVSSPILDFYLRISLGAGVPDITFTRIAVMLSFFVIILQAVLKMRRLLPLDKIEIAMLIFSSLALVTAMLKDNATQNVQVFIDGYGTPFVLFFLSKNLSNKESDIRSFLYATVIVGFYLAVIGIIQYFTEVNLLVAEGFVGIHAKRAYGPFTNAAQYGGALTIMYVGSLYLYTTLNPGFKKKLVLLAQCFIVTAIFLTMTRSVWLSFFMANLLISLYIPAYRKVFISLLIATVAGIAFAWLFLPDSSFFKERTFEVGPIYSRIILYAMALKTFLDNPLIGNGFGRYSFYEASREHLTTSSYIQEKFGLSLSVPHNEFLHILVMLGMVGFAAYMAILFYNVKYSRQLYKDFIKKEAIWKNLPVAFWAVLSTFAITGFFVDLLFFTYFNSLFYIFAGLVSGVYCRRDEINIT